MMTRLFAALAAILVLLLLHNFADGQTKDANERFPGRTANAFSKLLQGSLEPYIVARCEVEVGIALASGLRCPKPTREMLKTDYVDNSKNAILPWMQLELQDKNRVVSFIAIDYIVGIDGDLVSKEAANTISVYARRPRDWSGLKRVTDLLSMPSINIEDLDRSQEPIVIKERIYADPAADANKVVITLLTHDSDQRTMTAETRKFKWNGEIWQAE